MTANLNNLWPILIANLAQDFTFGLELWTLCQDQAFQQHTKYFWLLLKGQRSPDSQLGWITWYLWNQIGQMYFSGLWNNTPSWSALKFHRNIETGGTVWRCESFVLMTLTLSNFKQLANVGEMLQKNQQWHNKFQILKIGFPS